MRLPSRLRPALLAGLPVLALLAACSSRGNRPDIARSTILTESGQVIRTSNVVQHRVDSLAESGESAIRRVAVAYARLGLTPNVVDSVSGMVGVRAVIISRRLAGVNLSNYMDCGVDAMSGAPQADRDRVQLTLLTEVKPATRGSVLRTSLGARALKATSGASVDPRPCSSRGALEAKLGQVLKGN